MSNDSSTTTTTHNNDISMELNNSNVNKQHQQKFCKNLKCDPLKLLQLFENTSTTNDSIQLQIIINKYVSLNKTTTSIPLYQ